MSDDGSDTLPNLCPGWDDSWFLALKLWTLQIASEAMTYGAFACLVVLASIMLIQQGLRRSRARKILLFVILFMFFISTLHLALHLTQYLISYPLICATGAFPTGPGIGYLWNATYAGMALGERLQYLISDAIVVWRACVIWQGNRWVHGTLGFFYLGTLTTSVYLAVLNVLTVTLPAHYGTLEKNMLGTFGLLVTNFTATALIAYKTWLYRRTVKEFLYEGNTRTRVEGVLVLLVESGLVYLVYWVLILLSDFDVFDQFEFEWFQPNISGIYPTLIILAVSLRKSASDTILTLSRVSSGETAGTLRFNAFSVSKHTTVADFPTMEYPTTTKSSKHSELVELSAMTASGSTGVPYHRHDDWSHSHENSQALSSGGVA